MRSSSMYGFCLTINSLGQCYEIEIWAHRNKSTVFGRRSKILVERILTRLAPKNALHSRMHKKESAVNCPVSSSLAVPEIILPFRSLLDHLNRKTCKSFIFEHSTIFWGMKFNLEITQAEEPISFSIFHQEIKVETHWPGTNFRW